MGRVTGSMQASAPFAAQPTEGGSEENAMRIIILRGIHRFAPEQPHVIDVTPTAASVSRSWRQRARAGLSVLLAVIILFVAWVAATAVAFALVGVGALAVAVLGLRWRRQRTLPAGDE